ncbi:MAG: M56 family metallopeptidase [Bacteroidota bacterium]|nr:M56 family metallopeptidase [Bacteroidota bacterium]
MLVITLLSLLLPFISIPVLPLTKTDHNPAPIINIITSGDAYIIKNESSLLSPSYEPLIHGIYISVSLLLTTFCFIALIRIVRIIRSYRIEKIDNVYFINSSEKGTPFSFFNYIVWNGEIDLNTKAGKQIFEHELVHVREKHTIDKVMLLLMLIFFWPNPVFWLIRKELSAIHEFLADQKSVQQQEADSLVHLILQTIYPSHYFTSGSPFFQSHIKRRLAMLTKLKDKKTGYFSRIIAIPLLLLVAAAITLKVKSSNGVVSFKRLQFENILNEREEQDVSSGLKDTRPIYDTAPKQYYKGKQVKSLEVVEHTQKVILTFSDGTKESLSLTEAKKKKLILPPPPPPPPPAPTQFTPPNKEKDSGAIKVKIISLNEAKEIDGLIVIDDKVFNGTLSDEPVKADEIKSIALLTGSDLVKEYGEKAKKGVIMITTKDFAESLQRNRNKDSEPIFEQSENGASIDEAVWRSFMTKNLPFILKDADNKNIPSGTYTVQVKFIVEKDGTLSAITPLSHHGYGLEESVAEIMKKSPKWNPAVQNGIRVRSYHTQPVTIVIN